MLTGLVGFNLILIVVYNSKEWCSEASYEKNTPEKAL
jgi:hypothetical protein